MQPRAGAVWLACAAALAACTPATRPMTASAAPAGPATKVAERGIGGTGIIGVVTGFASICLAGHEVALSGDVVEFPRSSQGGIRIVSVVPSAGTGRSGFAPAGLGAASERVQHAQAPLREGGGPPAGARAFEPAPVPNRMPGFDPAASGATATNRFGTTGRSPGFRPSPGGATPGAINGPGPGLDGSPGRR